MTQNPDPGEPVRSKTLADLRAERDAAKRTEKAAPRPERGVTVCLAADLPAEVHALTEELDALPSPTASPRIGVGQHPRATEIRTRLAELINEMAQYEGEIRVRAIDDGDWRLWVNAHPARTAPAAETETSEASEGQPGWRRDLEVTQGYCNADDLIDDLSRYVVAWNGEPVADSDWENVFRPSLGSPDLKELAAAVVTMHESRLDFRRWRARLSAALTRSVASSLPEPSGSVPDGSSDGNPSPSSTASTEKATA